MVDQTPIQNLIPNGEPQLDDLLRLWKKDILLSFNCHAIAKVGEFFPDEQTVTVTLAYKQTFFRQNADGSYTPQLVDYPTIVKAPLVVIGGGGTGAVTFPIAAGDDCLICFNDRDIDGWAAGQNTAAPPSNRLHSFADALVIVGPRQNPLEDYDTERAVLRYKNARVGVGKDGSLVLIENDSTTLNTLLQDLIDEIKNLVTATNNLVTATAAITVTGVTPGGGTSGPPANAAAITAVASSLSSVSSALTATANDLGGLLE